MNYTELLDTKIPQIAFGLLGLASLVALHKNAMKYDIPMWMNKLNRDAAKATEDAEFRKTELEKTEAEIAKLPVPAPIAPISRAQEARLRMFPKLMLFTGLLAAVSLYVGLFHSIPTENTRWPVYAGWFFLAATLLLYLGVTKLQAYYSRVQLLNKRYLLEKAGNSDKKFATLEEVIEYYPHLVGLRLELADQKSLAGKYGEAVEILKKAAETAPETLDVAIAEASIQLRSKNPGGCETALERAERCKKAPTDPRIELYRAALEEERGNHEKAMEYARNAVNMDKEFCELISQKDSSLEVIRSMLEKEKLLEIISNP